MQSRREDIMDAAEKLFNEKGYNFVSLRDIADSIGISKGNLTYHFQKKEDLIEACVLRNHKNYQKPEVPQTLSDLNSFFLRALVRKGNWPYYFRNYMQLAEVCPKVYEIQCSVLGDLADVIINSIEHLTVIGEFRQDCSSAYAGIVQCIISVLAYGVPMPKEQTTENQLSCIWSILCPCLTEHGLSKFKQIPRN